MERKHQGEMICPNIKESADELKSVGSWTFHENLLYVVFLQRNKVIMQSKRKRRYACYNTEMNECSTAWLSSSTPGLPFSAVLTTKSS